MPRTSAGGSQNSQPMRDIPLRPTVAPRKVAINRVAPNPRNLREDDLGSDEEHRETVASVQSLGLIQALVVCTLKAFLAEHPTYKETLGDVDYVLLAGHRRLAAARDAGLTEVRIDVQDGNVADMDLVMLEENLKRKSLNIFQEGEGYRRVLEREGESYGSVAKKVGKSKSTIVKRVKCLSLPDDAKAAVLAKQLSVDTAYNLLVALDGQHLHRLLEAAALMKQDDLTASEAVNALFATGSGRTDDEPAAASAEPDSTAENEAAPSAQAGGQEAVLSEPAATTTATVTATATEPATIPPARTEPVLAEPADAQTTQAAADVTPPASAQGGSGRTDSEENPGRAEANAARNAYCAQLVAKTDQHEPDPQTVRIATTAIAQASHAAIKRAHTWLKAAGAPDADSMDHTNYRHHVLIRGDATLISRLAYAVALAEDEIRASNRSRKWNYRDTAHLRHLIDAGYEPAEWESRQLR